MAANQRLRWLGATLVVAVIALVVARSGSDTPPPTQPRRAPQTTAKGADANEVVAPVDVALEALQTKREAPSTAGRDPFRFRPKPAAEPTARRLPGVQDDQVGAPPPPRIPAGPPPPPPIALKFIGLVQKADGTKIAVLSDGKRPISGTEGEEIEGRYKILKIGTESIEIAYIDGRGRQTIRLTGQ
jgi:hypothetical protein